MGCSESFIIYEAGGGVGGGKSDTHEFATMNDTSMNDTHGIA